MDLEVAPLLKIYLLQRMEEISARFVEVDHDSQRLLRADLRDGVTYDRMVHFSRAIMPSCGRTVDARGEGMQFAANERGGEL